MTRAGSQDEVLEVLKEVAEEAGLGARHVVLSNRSSTATHIHAMRGTAVLVSRFSPALANVMFLPQGTLGGASCARHLQVWPAAPAIQMSHRPLPSVTR